MKPHFSPAALRFLQGIARHNDRTWFQERREIFEQELKAPMLQVIEELNHSMSDFAPDHLRPAATTMLRFYRDTRFSSDKRPYKEHISAWWLRRGMMKTSGAGFYLHVSAKHVELAAGVFMPTREQLQAIRLWMLEHHEEFRTLLQRTLKPRKSDTAPLIPTEARALTRMPKGFPSEHPADELVRATSWGVSQTLAAQAATQSSFTGTVATMFERTAPLVEILNSAILKSESSLEGEKRASLNRYF